MKMQERAQAVIGALAALLILSGRAFAAEKISYYGVYLKDAKIGSLTIVREEEAQKGGRPAVRIESAMELALGQFGRTNKILSKTTSWADPKSGAPIASETRNESSGRVTLVSALYDAQGVSWRADIQGTIKEGRLPLPRGESFLLDPSGGTAAIAPLSGKSLTGKVFLPDALKLVDSQIDVGAKETVSLGGSSLSAYRVSDRNPLSPGTYFLSESGELLKASVALGMEIRRESRESALSPPRAILDLGTLIGVRPEGAPLGSGRGVRSAVYELRGVTRALPASDSVQRLEKIGEGVFQVSVSGTPLPARGAPLFASPDAAPERLRPHLMPTAYVASDDPQFRAIARAILEGEKDSAVAAAKIVRFVHGAIRPDPSIAALRTAHDVNKDRRGVCRDYTTFFTAIARAAGLPTKQCVGLAYVDGLFQYHAWPEVRVGEKNGTDIWVALEPTWGAPFADATHLKLAEGEITDIFGICADIGRYAIKVLLARP